MFIILKCAICATIVSMHPLTETLLRNRGIHSPQDQQMFLAPDYERDVKNPYGILGMDRAVSRIVDAMREGESILVFGDYDSDGIPGTVVLRDFFQKIGYENVQYYIPHRHKEGYGFSVSAAERFVAEQVGLIITIDCGIADVAGVSYAMEHGVDVIVTDHHLPPDHLPPAYVILNSKQQEDTYHDDMLCGAAVAFKLVQALLQSGHFADIAPGYEKWLLDLVGIATISDMVPLQKENRALAYFGLKVLRKTLRPGLRALFAEAGVDQRYLSEDDIGFSISPRLNAASRIGDPMQAFALLSATTDIEAVQYAKALDRLNTARKQMTKDIVSAAHKKLHGHAEKYHVLVVGDTSWQLGIAGIAAAQLSEHYAKPVFVWAMEDGVVKGSCRSDGNVSVFDIMHAAPKDVFFARGGHDAAGGFTLLPGVESRLQDVLESAFHSIPKKEGAVADYNVDATLQLSDIHHDTIRAIDALAPYGEGNPRPLFLFPSVRVKKSVQFGKQKEHLRVTFHDETHATRDAIAWFSRAEDFRIPLVVGATVSLVAFIEVSRYGGREEIRLRIKDVLS